MTFLILNFNRVEYINLSLEVNDLFLSKGKLSYSRCMQRDF